MMKPNYRALAIAAVVMAAAACTRDAPRPSTAGPGSGETPLVSYRVSAAQVGAFSDSARASQAADSLSSAGWDASVAYGQFGELHRVRIAHSKTDELPARVVTTLRSQGVEAMLVHDSVAEQPWVEAVRVNRGTHGMASQVRWIISPNNRSLLVVHDPVSVEAEALPDGFVYATEIGDSYFQRDSVWDVAPSPDWAKLAFSEAYMLRAVEGESVPSARWAEVAAAVGMPEDTVRAMSFLASGMVPAYGFARPLVMSIPLSTDPPSERHIGTPRALPVAGGWRLRWNPDATILAVGDAPVRVQNHEPSPGWSGVDPETGAPLDRIAASRLAPVRWEMGPTLDISIAVDLNVQRTFQLEGATIENRDGWIYSDGKIVGPGLILAATRSGGFIAAITLVPGAAEYDTPFEPVVYAIARQ